MAKREVEMPVLPGRLDFMVMIGQEQECLRGQSREDMRKGEGQEQRSSQAFPDSVLDAQGRSYR
jgi:hypothetical protein